MTMIHHPSEVIKNLSICAGCEYSYTLLAGPENEPLYLHKNKRTLKLLTWINNKILFELPKIKSNTNNKWIGVRVKIATNMLNSLEIDGILPKDVCIMYHERLVKNVRQIVGNIYTEDLPF